MRGLVIGRFQPLHKGHQQLIQAAIEDCVNVVVGIGSARAKQDTRNPFSFEERAAMVKAVFGDKVTVVALPDIHDPTRWVDHVVNITGPIQKVYGNQERDLDLFEDEGYRSVSPGLVDRTNLQGTNVRALMAEDDPMWRRIVPPAVVKQLDEWGAASRLRLLEARL